MKQLGESTWVLEGPANIGFIERNNEVILIDSGNDKESGRKINKILGEKNWTLKAVVNTHSNADHIGGNDYLARNLDCEIYAPEIEDAFIEYPELEAAFLWGGLAVKDLRNKFFEAKPSRVTRRLKPGDEIAGGIKIIGLGGHFMNMIGVESPDGVLFLADCIFGEHILEKYGIPFVYDVRKYKETLRTLGSMDARYYVPSHGEITGDIAALIEINLNLVEKVERTLVHITAEQKTFDEILKGVCDAFSIQLNAGQYALVGSTVKSFLTYLDDAERIGYRFEDNRMFWKSVNAE